MEVKEKQDIRLIKKLRVKNFKSFKDVEVELGKFNVVIGANASGKSNFVQIFKFLRDIVNEGLENAISYQGGIEYLRNILLGDNEDLYLEVVVPPLSTIPYTKDEEGVRILRIEGTSKYALTMSFKNRKYDIQNESFTSTGKFVFLELKKKGKMEGNGYIQGEIALIRDREGKINIKIEPEELPIKSEDLIPSSFLNKPLPNLKGKVLLEEPMFRLLAHLLFIYISKLAEIAIYDFDPKLPKRAIPIAGKSELEEDGSNLALVLKKILADKKNREQFLYLMRNLLPFINKLDVEKFADKSLLVKLQEAYYKEYLPATLISDGTINLTALILALYFEEKPLIIIEEPERNIHPHLISKVVEMMKEASQNKQIIVTTHNPEVVRYAGLENLLLIYRDKEGFSHITRPADKIEVKTFLEQEIGIEELYVENLLTF
jgi:predicted ATPase